MSDDISSYSILELQALFQLSKKPRYGYELMQLLGSKRRKKVTAGTLYPILNKFKSRGMVKIKSMHGIREKKVYELSLKGRKELKKAGNELVGFLNELFTEFYCPKCKVKL